MKLLSLDMYSKHVDAALKDMVSGHVGDGLDDPSGLC